MTATPNLQAVRPVARRRIDWVGSIPFLAVHVAALTAFFLPFDWSLVALAVALYYVRMFGITAGYHRYFSHRSFKTSRPMQFVFACLAASSLQKGVLWWAAHHRDHHRHSDTPQDIHSPVQDGLFWSHIGWVLSRETLPTKFDRIKDFARYPELRWLNHLHVLPFVLMCIALFAIGGMPWLVWGGFVSTVLLWHGTFTINSLSHVIGRRRFATRDDSRNNWFLALLTCGEGWHNNHHRSPGAASQGMYWWELDMSYYVLRLMSMVGLVWDLNAHPDSVYAEAEGREKPRRGKSDVSRLVG